MGIIRTQKEILDFLNSDLSDDIFGTQKQDLISFLSYKNAIPFLKDGVSKQEWEEDKENIKSPEEKIKDYLPFAWEKANNCRGLSANRSLYHFLAWTWLCDDEFYKELKYSYDNNYEFYGKPQLELVSKRFGFLWKNYDNGIRTNE